MHMVSIELLYIYIFYKGVCSVCWCMQYHLAGKKCDTVLLFLGRLEKGTPAYTAYTLCNTVFLRGQGRANQTGTRGNRVRFSQFTVKPWVTSGFQLTLFGFQLTLFGFHENVIIMEVKQYILLIITESVSVSVSVGLKVI